MTKLLHSQAKDNFLVINMLSDESINNLNKLPNVHVSKQKVNIQITIKRKEEKPGFWKRLMETKPGFDKYDKGDK